MPVPEQITVIRPSAVLAERAARLVLEELEARDVGKGGVWSANTGIWQRYDKPWNGTSGLRGTAKLVGTIGIVYGTPSKLDVTIYRATVTEHGLAEGWSVDRLCDDALKFADLTLASCPRTTLSSGAPDPFRQK